MNDSENKRTFFVFWDSCSFTSLHLEKTRFRSSYKWAQKLLNAFKFLQNALFGVSLGKMSLFWLADSTLVSLGCRERASFSLIQLSVTQFLLSVSTSKIVFSNRLFLIQCNDLYMICLSLFATGGVQRVRDSIQTIAG